MQLPSASNTSGTLLGTLAGAAVASFTPSLPIIITTAAALGTTPLALAAFLAVAATALTNYAATHIAEVQNLNELVKNYWPQIEDSYPGGKNGQEETKGFSESNINKS
jgi:hypothetical protein